LTGTPLVSGSYPFTVEALDAHGCSGFGTYSISVACPVVAVEPPTLPTAAVNVPYGIKLTGTNGAPPFVFSIVSGSLPTGMTFAATGTLTGTPTQSGTFPIVVEVTDAHSCTGTNGYNFQVACPPLSILPNFLPFSSAGDFYFQDLVVTGAVSLFPYSGTAGQIPNGLTVSSSMSNTGLISGVTTTVGDFFFTITAVDSNGCSASQNYNIDVTCPFVEWTPDPLPNAAVGANYYQVVIASGAAFPATYTVISGTLPPGLTLATDGVLSGIPTSVGTYTFTISETDSSGCINQITYTIVVSCATLLDMEPQTLPNPTIGTPYNQTLTVLGNVVPLNFVLQDGSLPPGLVLGSNGVISGTPTLFGTFTFHVLAVDLANGCTGSRYYTLVVGCPIATITPTALAFGNIGVFYSQIISASGGTPPYTFTQTGGSLPAGLTLSTTGVLSGIPTSSSSLFTLSVKDANGCVTAIANIPILIFNDCPTITLTPGVLSNGTVGVSYNQTVIASGGETPYTLSVYNGALPPGLLLLPSGVLSGTPTASGSYTFTLVAYDGEGCPGFQTYTMAVACDTVAISPSATLTNGIVGMMYTQQFTATGYAPVTFAVTGGTLPDGLTIDNTGSLSGTPTLAGAFAFTLTATDAGQCSASQLYDLTIEPSADLSIVATANPDPVMAGSNVTYTLFIANLGPSDATGVTVTDALPAGVTFVSASTGCGSVSNLVACDLGDLPSGVNTTVTIVASTSTEGIIANAATITSAVFDPNLTNNSWTVISTVTNVVEFGAVMQVVNANAHAAIVSVTRRGNLESPVTVQYSASNGTAVGGTDYTPVTGSLFFGAGVVNQTFVVPILNPVFSKTSKAGKTVKLALSNPTGALVGGRSTALIDIIGSPSQSSLVFTNADDDVVTVKLTGAGAMQVSLVARTGPIGQILLTNTDTTTSLSVAVKRSAHGAGVTDIGEIISDGSLKNVSAPDANLEGAGLAVGGALGSLTLNAVLDSAVTVNGGLGSITVNLLSNALVAADYVAGNPDDPLAGGVFGAAELIKTVKVKQLIASTVAAPQIGTVQLGTVDVANGGAPFGILAQTTIGSVKVASPVWTWNPTGANDQSVTDFHVKHN
jgi:uncharacterized repeat protein (TIGR01451 family)